MLTEQKIIEQHCATLQPLCGKIHIINSFGVFTPLHTSGFINISYFHVVSPVTESLSVFKLIQPVALNPGSIERNGVVH